MRGNTRLTNVLKTAKDFEYIFEVADDNLDPADFGPYFYSIDTRDGLFSNFPRYYITRFNLKRGLELGIRVNSRLAISNGEDEVRLGLMKDKEMCGYFL